MLKAMIVATNAVATHAMTIDATAQAERASAWLSSVMVCKIAAGMLSRTRSITLPIIIAYSGPMGAPGSCSAPCASRHISTAGLRQVSTKKSSFSTASLPRCLVMTTASTACGATNEAAGGWWPRTATHAGMPRTGEEARTCTAMLKQIIATIAYAGPRWLRENRLTVVFKSETRSPVPSSVETIARTTMPGTDL